MHLLCKGSVNLRRYHVSGITKSILFPYRLANGEARLLSTEELAERFANAWDYLKENRQKLEARERGKWKHDRWYAFGRSQNLAEMEQMKILTPSIANRSSFTLDRTDFYYFVGSGGGGGGGYGITFGEEFDETDYLYLLGILNAKLIDWFLKRASSPFSGGYYSYNRQYIEQIPIHTVRSGEAAEKRRYSQMIDLVDTMLQINRKLTEAKSPQAKTVIQRQIEATNRQIDKLVYKLYDLTDEEIEIVEAASG